MLRQRLVKLINLPVPLYFFGACVVLLLCLAVGFGWMTQRAEQFGPNSVPFGSTVLRLAASPNAFKGAFDTVITLVQGGNPELKSPYKPRGIERFEPLTSAEGAPQITGPKLYATTTAQPGWRIIVGTFRIDERKEDAALLLNRDMQVVHWWRLAEDDIDHFDRRKIGFKFPHGFEILPDGSIFYSFDNGVSVKRMGFCGETLWSRIGYYHHAISLDEDGQSLWTLRRTSKRIRTTYDLPENRFIEQLDSESGEVLTSFTIAEIIEANPHISIFKARKQDKGFEWVFDPFHENDVEPLPASFAAAFPQFEPGDLLLSIRNVNLVLVLDPETRRIKWWRSGVVYRQHDPDWLPNGRIAIFDNNSRSEYSRIVEIEPRTLEVETVLDGGDFDFYTEYRGKHQVLSDRRNLVASTEQGRIFEVQTSGEVAFEFVNFVPGQTDQVNIVSEALWLPPDFFQSDDPSGLPRRCP